MTDPGLTVDVCGLAVPPPRPKILERPDYVPTCLSEEFIVPLLKSHITNYLNAYASATRAGDRALDVGCGRQPFRGYIESFGYEYVSMDAQQNPEDTVDFICPIDASLPAALVERGPFRLIVCTEVLEHVADWTTAFSNLASLLALGGRLLLTCPHVYIPHEIPYDFWRPTQYALRHYARNVGLRIVAMEQAGDGWEVLGTLLSGIQVQHGPSIRQRVAARLGKFGRRFLLRLALSPRLRRAIKLQSSIYLVNIALFEKP